MEAARRALGFTEEEGEHMNSLLAGILLLGQVEFKEDAMNSDSCT